MSAPARILLTGGAGFIGSSVVRILRERYPDTALRVLHLPRENLANLRGMDGIELMAGDVTNPEDCDRAVAGCDAVFHLAAVYALWMPDMSVMQRVNVEGTRNMLEACRRHAVRRVVYTSSAVCFCGQGLEIESTEDSAFSYAGHPYSISKHEAHQVAESFARDGMDVVIVCPAAPLGPGDVGPTPTGRMITGLFTLPVPLAVKSRLNFIDVRDCAMGHVLALEKGRAGVSYLLGGENHTYSDMLQRVLQICGIRSRVYEVPAALLYPLAWCLERVAGFTGRAPLVTPAEVEQARKGLVCNAGRARSELGLTTRPLDETLRDALAWFIAHGHVTDARARAAFPDARP